MGKKVFAASGRGRRRGKNGRPMPDSRIDLSDIPEVTDEELRLQLARSAAANGWHEPAMADYDDYDAKRAERCP